MSYDYYWMGFFRDIIIRVLRWMHRGVLSDGWKDISSLLAGLSSHLVNPYLRRAGLSD